MIKLPRNVTGRRFLHKETPYQNGMTVAGFGALLSSCATPTATTVMIKTMRTQRS